jgi:molybdopterin-containing oxidoreductase family iron-sulfur binding subunit
MTHDPQLPRFADLDTADTSPGRRGVLRAAGASLALAAASGCDVKPEEWGDPLHMRPRGVGDEAASYATVLELEGIGRGVLVRTRGGHPIKIEGNPDHPGSLGATDPFLESAVLSLHDPARSRQVRRGGRVPRGPAATTPEAAVAELRGEGLRILTGPVSSPTLAGLVEAALAANPGARWHQWSPVAADAALAGAMLAFGEPAGVLNDPSRAAAVLCFGGGLLEAGPAQLAQARGWARARAEGRAAGRMPLLVVAQSTPTPSGAVADRRLALPPAEIEVLARAVARELGLAAAGPPHDEAAALAALLRRAGPSALVVAGREQPAAVHALAAAINAALGAVGTTVHHTPHPMVRPEMCGASLRDLVAAMAAGEVRRLLVLDGNPVFDAPADIPFAVLLGRVPVSVHAGLHLDETALACSWHLPLKHPLESWGDARAPDGTAAIRQPACAPRVEAARSAEEILAALAGLRPDGAAAVRATWPALDDAGWAAALERGVIEASAPPRRALPLRAGFDLGPAPAPPIGLVAQFAPDPHLWDGRFAADAWLQELPRPLTKQVWGNAALVAPQDAARLGLGDGAEAVLTLAGRSLRVPVIVLPGQAAGVVTLPLGGGRRLAGGVGGGVGFDAYRIRTTEAPWAADGLELVPVGRSGAAPVRAGWRHGADARNPPPVRSVAPGEAVPPLPPQPSLYPDWSYPGYAWGMAIDLDACIGCNACSIACQAENNTPVVGPEEVARGREMHWLRVDLYAGEEGEGAFQPVPCMHCEKAPCEVVCPVNATVHDHEGLNLMVYARCIGTRTCSNNCPYKVRRFNWHGYSRQDGAVPVRNPEVPLRPRGVVEKCTYCQHRIVAARTGADLEGRPIRDGEVETACQRACPTQAIVFGDLNDPESAVARAKREGRNYALLGELGTRPRTTYLARVRPDGEEEA